MTLNRLLLLAAVICFVLAMFTNPGVDLELLGLALFAGAFLVG